MLFGSWERLDGRGSTDLIFMSFCPFSNQMKICITLYADINFFSFVQEQTLMVGWVSMVGLPKVKTYSSQIRMIMSRRKRSRKRSHSIVSIDRQLIITMILCVGHPYRCLCCPIKTWHLLTFNLNFKRWEISTYVNSRFHGNQKILRTHFPVLGSPYNSHHRKSDQFASQNSLIDQIAGNKPETVKVRNSLPYGPSFICGRMRVFSCIKVYAPVNKSG